MGFAAEGADDEPPAAATSPQKPAKRGVAFKDDSMDVDAAAPPPAAAPPAAGKLPGKLKHKARTAAEDDEEEDDEVFIDLLPHRDYILPQRH